MLYYEGGKRYEITARPIEEGTYLYAFDKVMCVVGVKFVEAGNVSINNLKRMARYMRIDCSSEVEVYAVDNRPGLYREFRTAIKEGARDFTKRIDFMDLVSREGIQL